MTGWAFEAFVERFVDAAEPMATLTDEELYVLTAAVAGEDRWIPLSVLDELTEADRRIAVRTAYRSLLAREIVAPTSPEDIDPAIGRTPLEIRGPLVPILDLLGDAWPLVLTTRRHDGVDSTQLWLNVADRLVLLQDVRQGIHRFWLLSPGTACRQLATALDPLADDRVAGASDRELVRGPANDPPVGWMPLRSRIGQARATAQLIALRKQPAGAPDLAAQMASLDDAAVLVMGASPDEHGDATEVVARQLSPASVVGLAVHALGLTGLAAGDA